MKEFKHENILHKRHFDLQFSIRFEVVDDVNFYSPFHWHNHIEILYVLEGKIDFTVEQRKYLLTDGDMIIINSELIHSSKLCGHARYILLQVPLSAFEGVYDEIENVLLKEKPESGEAEKLFSYLSLMLKSVDDQRQENKIKFISLLYDFFYQLLTSYKVEQKKAGTLSYYGINRISPVMAYVEKEFRNKISLSDVAEILNVTPEHMCRLFKKYTDMTFNEYLMSLRISAFYQMLQNTNQKISVILEECGITNYKVFIREFKKTFGKTPEVIRSEMQGS
ncbi:AraC family transcriptional regulator [Treponema ruminis]|uniref:AraC-like DNA-binding protein/mannose-6-phosphate isomerase-like protein (Cupin superfamily) n=1 Tax=Treponema ruminis TaxID=744515 RepID=A0A7W8LLL5_9SPIR|nr:AraC family transcriptional regulator [Treponema ruminis]MBB5225468.1 AraC-like DNA-binding protein/mannose-6-phosphate isomerase-like protein (cupin superfamily) [Treponema ruminis]QSI01663.1 AraC family transcriptional regulator [Treponema ruminis]